MEKIIDSIQAVLAKVDFLNLGGLLSPAIYILAIGAILVLITFFIALAIKAGSKANKLRKHLDDTVAYVEATGTIDADNVEGLKQRIQDKIVPDSIVRGWGRFLEQQTGYPSNYMSESECLGAKKGNPNYKSGKAFFNVVSALIIIACIALTVIGCYGDVFSIDVKTVEGVKDLILLVLPVLATLVGPLLVYVIFGAFLNLAGTNEGKKLEQSFKKFTNTLDTYVIIFREPQDEFISENIEEINSAIEEILASKLGDSDILEIITTPKVEEDKIVEEETVEIAPVEVEEEVVAVVDEVEEDLVAVFDNQEGFEKLREITGRVANDAINGIATDQELAEVGLFMKDQLESGRYSDEAVKVFGECYDVCAGVYLEYFENK